MKKRVLSCVLSISMIAAAMAVTPVFASEEAGKGEYTYRSTTSMVSTWSPTDWLIASEWDIISYTSTPLYNFQLNETYDGYDIVPMLAIDYPEDVTAEYAGNEIYGVPADAEEGYAWKVSIRDDVCWEDGTILTVDELEYTLQQYLNPQMKNYRAATYYSGNAALANAKAYYEAGGILYSLAVEEGLQMADLNAGDDGQYADADGRKIYITWNVALDDWLGGYSLEDYSSYFTEEAYSTLDEQVNADGYVPLTDETKDALYSMTGSDDFGNETEEDLINYMSVETGLGESVDWSNVGFVKNDDHTFTIILANATTESNFEYSFVGVFLNQDLYEANKKETGGIVKSSYGTSLDKYSSYGPYKLSEYQEGKQITLVKNENWFGYSQPEYEGQYQTTAIDLQIIDEHTTRMSLFKQGNLDEVELITTDMEDYGTSDYIYFTPESYTYYLAMNTDRELLRQQQTEGVNKVIYSYEDFRHALSLAIDRNDYVMSCTSCSDPTFGLLNHIYISDPETGLAYRDTEYAEKALCDVYGVSSIDELTGYDVAQASALLQSAYDQCLADGNIKEDDIIEIEYHVYGSDTSYQKIVDYVNDALQTAAVGTSLEGRISVILLEDPDFYNSMANSQSDLSLASWGGNDLDPYSLMGVYCDPEQVGEPWFDVNASLTISVAGEEITKSFYEWYIALCEGEYATADVDIRNEVLAGLEAGVLSDYHNIPLYSLTSASLFSQRIVWPCEWVNSVVNRGGIQFLTYTMDDAEWAAYCAEQNNNLTY